MKTFLNKVATVLAIAFASHSAWSQTPASTIDIGQIRQIKDPQARAAEMVTAAEKLMTPSGYMFAGSILAEAQAADPNNKLAAFYAHVLAPQMETKGILKKISKLVQASSPEVRKSYRKTVRAAGQNPSVQRFLFDSPDVANSEAQLQTIVDRFIIDVSASRAYFKSQNQSEFYVTVNKTTGDQFTIWKYCQVNRSGDVYQIARCPYVRSTTVLAQSPDLEALAQIAGGMQILATLPNSYDLTGGAELSNGLQGKSGKQVISILESHPEFGRARNTSGVPSILSLGADLVSSVKWAFKLQNQLCAAGEPASTNRPGNLFSTGICVPKRVGGNTSMKRLITITAAALSGSNLTLLNVNGHVEVAELKPNPTMSGAQMAVQPSQFFSHPVADLHGLLPNSFDSCGQVTGLKDPSVGGVAVNRDAPEFIRSFEKCR